jgi:hypothetical protein
MNRERAQSLARFERRARDGFEKAVAAMSEEDANELVARLRRRRGETRYADLFLRIRREGP